MTIEDRLDRLASLIQQNGEAIQTLADILDKKVLSAQEAADYLGYSYRHFVVELKNEIPHEKVGKHYRFKLRDLEEWKEKYLA